MMNILHKREKIIFDGDSDNLANAIEEVSFDTYTYQVSLKKLKPLEQLSQHYKNISPDDISSSLGLKVTIFDGMKIYNGSKRGLKLYYKTVTEGEKSIILVFSFGELQPGRFICQFEEAVSL